MIRLTPPWQTGAVLQHGQPQQLRGVASAHQRLQAQFHNASTEIRLFLHCDGQGHFCATVPALPPSGPWTLSLSDADNCILQITDLWFGQLLLCAGQSNLGWPLARYPSQLAAAQQHLQSQSSPRLVRCYQSDPGDFRAAGTWLPLSSASCAAWPALLYHLSQALPTTDPQDAVMLGWVDLSWPGSAIDAWLPAADTCAHQPWQAGALFSARLSPWLSQPFQSLLWYQGEQDAMGRDAALYGEKLQQWLDSCRRQAGWQFPLLLVQIAGFGAARRPDPANGFVQIRLAQQAFAAQTAQCALVSAADLGAADDIHPPFKAELARRLAISLQAFGQNPGLLQAELQHRPAGVRLTLPVLAATEHWQVRSADGNISGFYWQDGAGHWSPLPVSLSADRRQLQLPLPATALVLGYGISALPQLSLYTSQGLPLLPQIWRLPAAAAYCG